MSTSVSLGFAIGVLAATSSCALPFALAALGLRAASHGDADDQGLRAMLASAAAGGASAGLAFAVVFIAALALEEAGVELSDMVPVAALALALAVVVLGARALAPGGLVGTGRMGAAAVFGLAYAIASLPCALLLLQGLTDLAMESRGVGGAIASVVLFFAGALAALISLAISAEVLAMATRPLGAAGRAFGAALAVVAATFAVLFWLPAFDGVSERGGAVADAASEVAGAVGRFAAAYTLVFALVLLVASLAALRSELRRPSRS